MTTGEDEAFACSGGTASRAGNTLRIRITERIAKTFVDTGGEADASYEYRGRVGPGGLHVVERMGGEHAPGYLLVHPRSGIAIATTGLPVVSPDSTRFAVATALWVCVESPDQQLEIWRFADPKPELEWSIAALRCDGPADESSGWAAVDPVWHTRDTLSFTRIDQPSKHRRTMLVVRGGGSWHLVAERE